MSAVIADAVALWRGGQHEKAEQACTAILERSGNQIDALGLLAEIYSARGQFSRAVENLQRVAELRPGDASAKRRLGDALFAAGEYERAAGVFRSAINIDPKHPRSHNNLGRCFAKLGQRDPAIASYRKALALDPNYVLAHNNLGIALIEAEQLEEGLACYETALRLNPKFAEAHTNRGNVLLHLDRAQDALHSHQAALALEPRSAAIHCNCGNALLKLQRPTDALECYEQALRISPDYPDALSFRGNALRELKRNPEALESYDRAIALQPDNLEVLSNRANILLELERYQEALDSCDRILKIRPDFPRALLFRGLSLKLLGRLRYDDAMKAFAHLWEADPTAPYGLGHLLYTGAMIADWSKNDLVDTALTEVAAGKPVVSPLAMLSLSDSAPLQLECARSCVIHTHAPAAEPIWKGERWRNEKIRLAYLSGDLRDHALSYLMAGVFEKHDRDRFQVFGVSFAPPVGNPFGLRVASSLDYFLDVREQTDQQVAQLMRELQIDIAIDLTGFTQAQRLNIFAHRGVPVQVSYLGYPGTSGAPYMDYIVADPYLIPPRSQKHYSEQIAYLPECFQANDDQRAIAPERPSRAAAGLPEDAFVFCSFNSGYKVSPGLFDVWCRILKACPGSVLWMIAESGPAQNNLHREAAKRDIDPQRILFADRQPYDKHLARMQLADLFLDTLPFNAGTTASDALWAGLPILTCSGESFASRMAGSLLRAVGLPELVTNDLPLYEWLAIRLAQSPEILALLRKRLASNRVTYPLFDTVRFCRHLESAYETMHDRFQRGEPAATFHVPPHPPSKN